MPRPMSPMQPPGLTAAACTEVLLTLLQDIAYSSDRSFADQRRTEGGSNLDWELEVRCHRRILRALHYTHRAKVHRRRHL